MIFIFSEISLWCTPGIMMTSSNGNIFRVTGPLRGEFPDHRWLNYPHKGQWRGALMFCLIRAWINGWVNNREIGDLRPHRAHYDVIVMHKSALARVMAWCCQATSHYLSQCWPRSMSLDEKRDIFAISNFVRFGLKVSDMCSMMPTVVILFIHVFIHTLINWFIYLFHVMINECSTIRNVTVSKLIATLYVFMAKVQTSMLMK